MAGLAAAGPGAPAAGLAAGLAAAGPGAAAASLAAAAAAGFFDIMAGPGAAAAGLAAGLAAAGPGAAAAGFLAAGFRGDGIGAGAPAQHIHVMHVVCTRPSRTSACLTHAQCPVAGPPAGSSTPR